MPLQNYTPEVGLELCEYVKKDETTKFFWVHIMELEEDPIDNRISPIFDRRTDALKWYNDQLAAKRILRMERMQSQ